MPSPAPISSDFYHDRRYWIIGASDGIGAALAEDLSARGARLVLSARRPEALNAVAGRCPGPVETVPLDLADPEAIPQALEAITTEQGPLDGAICVAALYDPGPVAAMDLETAADLVTVNLLAACALPSWSRRI